MSATQRTIKALKDEGYMVGIVEKFVKFGKFGVRRDLFGLFDIIAVKEGEGIIGVQCFTTKWTEHYDLFLGPCEDAARTWLASGGRIELWGWSKKKIKRGGTAVRWTPRVEVITEETYGTD